MPEPETAAATAARSPGKLKGLLRGSMMPVFFGLTVTLLALALVIMQTIFAQREARARAMNEGDTLLALQHVMQTMLDAETGQRGYVLTGNRDYLQPYIETKPRVEQTIERLHTIARLSQDSHAAERINWLAALADAKFSEMDRTISLTRSGLKAQALELVYSDFGKQQMDAIRIEIARQSAEKARQRRGAFASADTFEQRLIPLIAVLGMAIIALIFAGFRAERNRATAAAEAEQASALREANERTQLLARELNHRVKNLFSVILSIVALSGRKQAPAAEVVENIRARIHALSLAHAASQGVHGEHGADLNQIVSRTMQPYADDEGRRVRIDGPPVQLPARVVTPIGLIIHELATNAVKYGALSAEEGTVTIAWDVADGQDVADLHLTWIENGGPALSIESETPGKAGFGSQMTGLAARQLGGSIEREWPASGAIARLRFPLPKLETQTTDTI